MESLNVPLVKIRPKGQITIPADILNHWSIDINDKVNVTLVNGVVTLTPEKRKNKKSILSYAGIGKGLWGDSVEKIDNFISNERNSWEK
jgi:bifunctional DNA-binding transcriptional regulator/antitoxin component of YhaV-PrlF toxin-antitoxin module